MADTQLGFYFDQTRCMSCNACTVACKDWNQIEPGLVNWRKQFAYEDSSTKQIYPFAMGCNHCEEPACMKACAAQAISKDADGIVTIDREKCFNVLACIDACPFNKPKIAGDKQEPYPTKGWQVRHPAQKCTMCKDRLEEGLKPACVMSCVGRALDFGTLAELKTKYPTAVRLNSSDFPYVYENNTTDTGPALLVKKRTTTINIRRSSSYTGQPE